MGPWVFAVAVGSQTMIVHMARHSCWDETLIPGAESPAWKFEPGAGTLAVTSRSIQPAALYGATYAPIFMETKTPVTYRLRFSIRQADWVGEDVEPIIAWCRPRMKSAPLQELEPRLWLAISQGREEQANEASRLLPEVYIRFRSGEGMANLLKMVMRNGPADYDAVLRASERLLWKLSEVEAIELAGTMSRECPGWREELESRWPLNADEPWDDPI